MSDEKEKGFRVIDKRRIGRDDAPEEKNDIPTIEKEEPQRNGKEPGGGKSEKPPEEEYAPGGDSEAERPAGHVELSFTHLVESFFFQALASLGMIEGEGPQKGEKNLDAARQFIDILGILDEKTKGNLSPQEEMFLRESLSQLRMAFVQRSKGENE